MQGLTVLRGCSLLSWQKLTTSNLSSVLALGCGTRWDGPSPVWNRLVWGWEWEWDTLG